MASDGEYGLSDAEGYFEAAFSNMTTITSPSKLLQMPPEILTVIVEEYLLLPNSIFPDNRLKDLRLVHPQLAYLRFVCQELFNSCTLSCTPERLRSLEKGPVMTVAPFVRKVIFAPHIVYRAELPPQRARDATSTIEHALGLRTHRAIESGRAEATWNCALQKFTRANHFVVSGSQSTDNSRINCGPSSHSLLELALDCLKTSACAPREFSVAHHTDDEFVYTKIDAWEQLDFTKLKTLYLHFKVCCLSRKWDYKKSFRHEVAAVLGLVLKRSINTLTTVTLSCEAMDCVLSNTAPLQLFPLPKLQQLRLCEGTLDPERFRVFLAQCPGLQKVLLEQVSVENGPDLANWRPVFEAIRDVPNNNILLECLRIDVLTASPYTSLTFVHQIPEKARGGHAGFSWDAIAMEIFLMLQNFVSQRGEWDIKPHWDPANYADEDNNWDSNEEPEYDEEDLIDPNLELPTIWRDMIH